MYYSGGFYLVSGTVLGVCGLLLFSPYHTYFSATCFAAAQSVMASSSRYPGPPSSTSDEEEDIEPVRAQVGTLKKSKNLLATIKKEGFTTRKAEPKYVDMKAYNALQVQVINLSTKFDNLRVELTAAQNEIAILKRSMPRVGLGPSPSFAFYPINK